MNLFMLVLVLGLVLPFLSNTEKIDGATDPSSLILARFCPPLSGALQPRKTPAVNTRLHLPLLVFSFLSTNVRSLKSKLKELEVHLQTHEPTFLGVCETWLDGSIKRTKVFLLSLIMSLCLVEIVLTM